MRSSRLLAGLAALVVLATACTRSQALSIPKPLPTTHPSPFDAASLATRWPIKHVIFLIKENRTFDSMFGRFPGANGATFGSDHGVKRPLVRGSDQWEGDVEHCYPCALQAWNHGKMDGFNRDALANKWAYTQYHKNQLPNYWHWAQQNVLADNFFSSEMGPSFPNHLYAIAAQSGGAHDNPVQDQGLLKARHSFGFAKSWGCDSVKGAYVAVTDTEGHVMHVPPCFDFKTEGDLLTQHHVPWGYYASTEYQSGYLWSAYAAVSHFRDNPQAWQQHIHPVDNLIGDIQNNLLPPVTWVTPRFELSEHPEYNFCQGENWTTKVVDAIMNSPEWKNTAIFITWDDYGGFYDHVPPPQVDNFGFGFRVPLLLISPYAKQGVVDHHLGEFSSVLRFIEDNWGLTQLTNRDRRASDLSYDFNFRQAPRPPDPLPLRTDCLGTPFQPSPTPPPGE